jgi:hypothetical protein
MKLTGEEMKAAIIRISSTALGDFNFAHSTYQVREKGPHS